MMGSMLQMQGGATVSTAITDGEWLSGHDYNDKEHDCTISRSMNIAAESAYGMGRTGKGSMHGSAGKHCAGCALLVYKSIDVQNMKKSHMPKCNA